MADYGSKMERQAEFTPTEARDVLSADAHRFVDQLQPLQEKYAANATYNGEDAQRRLREAP